MDRQRANTLPNFEESKSEILKKRLLKSVATNSVGNVSQTSSHNNVLLNTVRTPSPGSMIVSTVQAPQPLTHSLMTHSLGPVKIHPNTAPYPLQLSTVHVPVQIPGSNSNISVPVHLSGAGSNMHMQNLQITPVSMPIQMSGTTNVPVQLPAGDTINVPLQMPGNQNIQLTQNLPSMPLLQNTNQIIHVMGGNFTSNAQSNNNANTDINTAQIMNDNQVKMSNQVQKHSPAVVQIPNSSNNSIQLSLPSSASSGPVQLRGTARTMPHVVYIQTPTGLKPVSSSDVISQASSSGNPPQIIVRRPVTSNSNILISNVNSKPSIAPKTTGQRTSILAPGSTQSIVIQKPKSTDKVMVPVSIAQGPAKQAIYLSSVKKKPENQSILISNNQNSNMGNQKVFLTPMNVPKIQNTKFILPVTMPAAMATKGPIINLQIANGQIQNDPQGNSITVMRETATSEASDIPPLQPLAKNGNKESNSVPQSPKSEKAFTLSITGSRAEPTGEQGEYTLSIPETNDASMNDDIYTVSIADEDGRQREKSFTLAIPEKSKSLLNRNVIDKSEIPLTVPAPAILRRSNSDSCDKNINTANAKRRISLCADINMAKSFSKHYLPKFADKPEEENAEKNDDHRVPSLFCDEKLEEVKTNLGDSDAEEFKDRKQPAETEDRNVGKREANTEKRNPDYYFQKMEKLLNKERVKNVIASVDTTESEDPLGLVWNNGIAHLKGSALQLQTNEFGLIDVIDHGDPDEILLPSVKYQTPIKQRIERGNPKKPTSPEDMYRCDGCGCHGMAAEFITPNFCSIQCQSDVLKNIQKKRERERLELLKRRNKMKKLFMRKQFSESEISNKEDKVSLRHYDSTPADLPPEPKDEFIENEKYPWMCGKNGFSWMRYLDFCKAKAAPVRLFKDPFPYNKNNFKVGMRMEAIDPSHPALFCVVSVAEVQGYRMRLHFDEYPEVYDYWVNADCIDLFPAGWCERNGRTLTPPPPYTPANFSWPLYLKQQHAISAPKHLFAHLNNMIIKPNGFRIGMKLEAEDRSNDLVCVATIADMLDNRLRINFDSWDDMYDMWVDPTSPYIHPVGWAEENGVPLTPPNFYKSETFSWESYLAETGAAAAPARAFKTRAPHGFKPGMKLEFVDPRVPFLIRVASISSVSSHRVRVTCDGWGPRLAAWRDDDHPSLRPVGWCLKTQHPLEPPLTVEELNVIGACGVGGCRGLGSLRGGPHKQHANAHDCPYRTKPATLPDRLTPRPADTARIPAKQLAKLHPTTPTADSPKEIVPNKPTRGRPPKHKRVEQVAKDDMSEDESVSSNGVGGKRWRASASPMRTYSRTTDHRSGSQRSPPPPAMRGEPPAPPRVPADKYIAELGLPATPLAWTENDVSALVTRVAGTEAGEAALAARLRGCELIMASCEELVSARLRLGPAVKVRAVVHRLREAL